MILCLLKFINNILNLEKAVDFLPKLVYNNILIDYHKNVKNERTY